MYQRLSDALPVLEFVPTDRLILHEDADPRRVARLVQRLQEDQRLKNPPVAAPIRDSKDYVVLDGANRVSALRALAAPHIVVQIIHYDDPGVELDTWYHVVAGISQEAFEAGINGVAGLSLVESGLEEAREALAIGDACAYIVCANCVYQVRNGSQEQQSDIRLLNKLVSTYKGKADIYRASNDDFHLQSPYYPDMVALVIFPRYRPADIIKLVRAGDRVPSGITRHIIPQRALRINIPLKILLSEESLEAKQAHLREWWKERMAANALRFYSESTFLFDE